MELWGGHECTVNRVGDFYRDQTLLTGHQHRPDDLARFADLGLTAIRYPVLWERVAPEAPDRCDWRWTDARLAEIGRLGMRPIIGLVHHGSGPRYTSLVADNFASLLADYAEAAARRYPHVADWTPVNEPLTTARFSALYGLWYPHARDERLFWLALLNQIDGTRAAMRRIRAVNPAARLVQTEDLGETYATAPLAGVAAFYNDRRWMTWDLLTGAVVPGHALWSHVARQGFGDRLRAIADDPCPPDLVGVNHYMTSDRFLDHRLDRYPRPVPAEGYQDLTAARVLTPPPAGLTGALRQAWQRYGLPVGVTECHLGCTREEQLRWLWQSWQACRALARDGAEVRALTVWALLGSVDWNSLITRADGHYEPGAFDVRGPDPRPTAVARLMTGLAGGAPAAERHPVLAGPGWWQRDVRLEHEPFRWTSAAILPLPRKGGRPLVVIGATGTLGRALAGACDMRGILYRLTDRTTLPIDCPDRIAAYLDEHAPWAVVNAAGWVRVDDAEADPAGCMTANADGARNLARACADRGIHCTIFSSDLVFDGDKGAHYVESDPPTPLNVYGRSKAAAERAALACSAATLVVRTAAFFSPYDPHNFAWAVEHAIRDGAVFEAAETVVSPTFVPDLARACLDLVVDGESGVWHLTSGEAVSWLEFGRRIAAALDLDPSRVVPAWRSAAAGRARQPSYAALGTERGRMLPTLSDAITRHAAVRRSAAEKAGRPFPSAAITSSR